MKKNRRQTAKVELKPRKDGTWYCRVSGPRTYAQITDTREAAMREILKGLRYCMADYIPRRKFALHF